MHGARIETILSMTPPCLVAADIGTDHGQVAAELLRRGIAGRVIATDISAPSLSKARERQECLAISNMETRLGDGLAPVLPGEVETAILAGMGGRLIARILGKREAVARSIPVFILQPMHSVRDLRLWLYLHAYRIESERLVREGDRFYHVMRVAHGQDDLTLPIHLEIGRRLIEDRDPLLASYIQHLMEKNQRRMDGIAQNDTIRARAALERCQSLNSLYREVLDETDGW